jgi:drug/metabolite transporter (DMT)-like permease
MAGEVARSNGRRRRFIPQPVEFRGSGPVASGHDTGWSLSRCGSVRATERSGLRVVTGAIVAALLAAALFAVATAFQHRSAGLVIAGGSRGGFVSRTLRHPLWIVGAAANLAGLGLHALALRDGPLTLVQPLLVIGVIFTLPLRQFLEHRRPRRAEIGWALALTLGLAVFLILATPADGLVQGADPAPMVFCAMAIALAISGCVVAGCRTTAATGATMLGTAAGLLYAVAAALLKETTNVITHGAAALFTAWPCYALVAVGGSGLLLSQYAYRAGPLSASLPAITAVNPVVSVVIGVAVFDEPFRTAPGYLLGEVLGLALMAVAAVGLTQSVPDARSDRPTERPPNPRTRVDFRRRPVQPHRNEAGRRPLPHAVATRRAAVPHPDVPGRTRPAS